MKIFLEIFSKKIHYQFLSLATRPIPTNQFNADSTTDIKQKKKNPKQNLIGFYQCTI